MKTNSLPGVATIFTFIWHLTFFAGCMAVSGYCEHKNLHSVICIKVKPVSKSSKCIFISFNFTICAKRILND